MKKQIDNFIESEKFNTSNDFVLRNEDDGFFKVVCFWIFISTILPVTIYRGVRFILGVS